MALVAAVIDPVAARSVTPPSPAADPALLPDGGSAAAQAAPVPPLVLQRSPEAVVPSEPLFAGAGAAADAAAAEHEAPEHA